MSTTDVTVQEAYDSTTGYDEMAVETHFGIDVHADSERKPGKWMRALVFVHMRHTEDAGKDSERAKTVMGMTTKTVNNYFAGDPEAETAKTGDPMASEDDEFDVEPATEAGKDSGSPAVELSAEQVSASSPE